VGGRGDINCLCIGLVASNSPGRRIHRTAALVKGGASGGGGRKFWSSLEMKARIRSACIEIKPIEGFCGLMSTGCAKYDYHNVHSRGPPGAAASGVTGGTPGLAGGVGGTVPPMGVSFNLYGLPEAQDTF
jgi:hypothetical protein